MLQNGGGVNHVPHAVRSRMWLVRQRRQAVARGIDTAVRPPEQAEGGVRMTWPAWPFLERYGYTWLQHPDGLLRATLPRRR
jgi:hypothetical protein